MPWLSASGVAAYLSVSRPTVYAMVEAGKLPAPVYLTPRTPRWRTDDIDAALAYRGAREAVANAIAQIGQDRPSRSRGRNRQDVSLSKGRAA